MRRGGFVRTLGALGASLAVPLPAAARTIDVDAIVARIPGIAGVYARTMDGSAPLIAIRAGEPFAAASIIKLTILVTAFRAFDAGLASPGEPVVLRASDLTGGSELLARARPGQSYRIGDLLRAMIQVSDNSASNALITRFGFAAIARTIAHCGMPGTQLRRHFAAVVAPARVSLNVTTPRDVGTLLYQIERGAREGLDTVAKSASCRAMIDLLLGQEDRSKIPAGLPPGTPVANKTGEITQVRNDAAIVDPYGDAPYVLVVLTRALDDTNAGNRGIAAIARRVDAALRTTDRRAS
jgi:beta-lactamase class A